MEEVKKGIYQHFKGGVYEVIDFAKHSETLEEMVIYKSIDTGMIWVRPKSMWNEYKELDGKKVQRFTYIGIVQK